VTDSSLPDFSPAIAAKKLGDASANTNITLAPEKDKATAEKDKALFLFLWYSQASLTAGFFILPLRDFPG
jgi:hypothetical protein